MHAPYPTKDACKHDTLRVSSGTGRQSVNQEARLNVIVFARNCAPLPVDMTAITGHFWHGSTALALTLVILLHLLGAFREPETIRRMV